MTKKDTAAIVGQIVAHHKLIEDLLARVKALEARLAEQIGRTITVVKLPPVDELPTRWRPTGPWKETPAPYCAIGGSANNPANSKIRRKKA